MACISQYARPTSPALVTWNCLRLSSRNRPCTEQKLQITSLVVTATTQLLRLLNLTAPNRTGSPFTCGTSAPENSITQLQDVMDALKVDYDQAYFLTGKFTRSLYADDCFFADPTISFTGTDIYERNLKLLIPFLEEPSLMLFSINKEPGEDRAIRAAWELRTHLKLPWRPTICVAGSTVYTLNGQLKIASHVEFWSVPVLEALSQIFRRGDNPS